uniref:Uncharacterized protein n=1 Tax=Anguilla anguilla TaxID=7936 RepID=A0A0E9XEF7_ANGAN
MCWSTEPKQQKLCHCPNTYELRCAFRFLIYILILCLLYGGPVTERCLSDQFNPSNFSLTKHCLSFH